MNILIATTSYPDENEGAAAAGVFVRDFALALHGEGVEVSVVAPGLASRQTLEHGLHVHRFAVPRLPLSLLKPYQPQDWLAIRQTMRAGYAALDQVCTERRIDRTLALWALPTGAWAQRVARKHNIPYATWALGSDIWTLGQLPLLRQWLRHVLRGAERRFADGLQLGDDVEHICGLSCAFLPSARRLSDERVMPPQGQPPYRLAFLGRWHANKGIDLLLEVLTLLNDADWQLIEAVRIFGGGPLGTEVHAAVTGLQQAGRAIEVGGYLNQAEATQLLAWADYVLIPSRIESIPVIFSDAMQLGRPVIAMPVGDLPALIERHGCGLRAQATNATAFAKSLRQALHTSPREFAAGIQSARMQFDIQASAQQFLQPLTPRELA